MSEPMRELWQRTRFEVARKLRRPVAGGFQPYRHTAADRYPWLFAFAQQALVDVAEPRLLSFGCSRGDELASLRRAFPGALIRGVDIAPSAIAACRGRFATDERISLTLAANVSSEPDNAYDAVFCLAVLCHGDLTVSQAPKCSHLFTFEQFERCVADLARCVRPGGLLFLHTTTFRFVDTAAAAQFETGLEAAPEQMAADLLYDRNNRLVRGGRYYGVGFRRPRSQ